MKNDAHQNKKSVFFLILIVILFTVGVVGNTLSINDLPIKKIVLPFAPHPGQQLVMDAWQTHDTVIANCHVGWGKTIVGQAIAIQTGIDLINERAALIRAGKMKNILTPLVNMWVVAPNYELTEQSWQEAKRLLPNEFKWKANETRKKLLIFPYEDEDGKIDYHWKISYRSGDRPDLLVSENVDIIIIEESRSIDKKVFQFCEARLARAGRLGKLLIIGTPGSIYDPREPLEHHWQYKQYLDAVSGEFPDMAAFKFGCYSDYVNPYLEKWKIDRAKRKMDPLTFQREMLAEFTREQDMPAVIENFSTAHQVAEIRDRYTPERTLYHCWDFGYRHPALSVWQFDAEDRLMTLGSRMGDSIELEQFARECLDWHKTNWGDAQILRVAGDAAGNQKKDVGRTSIDLLESIYADMGFQHIKIDYVHNSETQHETAIEILNQRCRLRHDGTPGWLIDKTNAVLEQALSGGWSGDERRQYKSGRPKPKKDGFFDHLGDTCIIMAMNYLTIRGDHQEVDKFDYDDVPAEAFYGT